jgi:hypothetical protein
MIKFSTDKLLERTTFSIIFGKVCSGKTTLSIDLLNKIYDKNPLLKVNTTVLCDSYNFLYKKNKNSIYPMVFIEKFYENLMSKMKEYRKTPDQYTKEILVICDPSYDFLQSIILQKLVYNRRKYFLSIIIEASYLYDAPKDVIKRVDYFFNLNTFTINNIAKTYLRYNYDYDKYKTLLNDEAFSSLVIDNTRSTDNISWYKAKNYSHKWYLFVKKKIIIYLKYLPVDVVIFILFLYID